MEYNLKLHQLVTEELHDCVIGNILKSTKEGASLETSINKAVDYIRVRTNNLTSKQIKNSILFTLIDRDVDEINYYEELALITTPTHLKIWNKIKKYTPRFRDRSSFFLTLFLFWGCLNFIFYVNDTYSINFNGQVYIKNVSEHIYNEYVYKLPGDYGNYLIPHTVQTYFGVFPDWVMIVFYFGYFVLAAFYINHDLNKK